MHSLHENSWKKQNRPRNNQSESLWVEKNLAGTEDRKEAKWLEHNEYGGEKRGVRLWRARLKWDHASSWKTTERSLAFSERVLNSRVIWFVIWFMFLKNLLVLYWEWTEVWWQGKAAVQVGKTSRILYATLSRNDSTGVCFLFYRDSF